MARNLNGSKRKVLHVRLIEHYISAEFQTCTKLILTDSLKIKENFAKNVFFFNLDLE